MEKLSWSKYIVWSVCIALSYFLAAKTMLYISSSHVALVWPSAGIALTALLFRGWQLWPAVLLGSLLANMDNGVSFLPALCISIGSTLAALTGWYLLIKVKKFSLKIDKFDDLTCFILYGCIIAPMISAFIGNMSLVGFAIIDVNALLASYFSWWFGDAIGTIIVGSLIIMIISPYIDHNTE